MSLIFLSSVQAQPATLAPVQISGSYRGSDVAITLVNKGTQSLSLQKNIKVEGLQSNQQSNQWVQVRTGYIWIMEKCYQTPPECVTIKPSQTLTPPNWFGTIGDAQCACDKCAPVPSGLYRFVVTSCDGKEIKAGEAFAINHQPDVVHHQ